jgi:P27 family predicted phage terminase small subunit
MTRGRKPKPHNLQVIDGNPGKREKLSAPLQVEVLFEPPPPELDNDPDARAVWIYLMPELVKYQLYTRLDRPALVGYCIVYGQAMRNHRSLLEVGSDIYETHGDNGTMYRTRPEVGIISDSFRTLRSIGSEFGLSPVSRKHLGNVAQGELFGDPFGKFDR